MSDKKKQVIHVKDLIIKADNVTIDQPERKPDPWFGPRRPNPLFGPVKEQKEESSDRKNLESSEEKIEESPETKPQAQGYPLFGPDRRERRDFDPILGRPLNDKDESSESLESPHESKDEEEK